MRWLVIALVAAASVPAVAQIAQDDTRYAPEIETNSDPARPPGTYVVVEGDTLWGLSEQLFGDGHYWPTLWSYNPQITNPHWIYPGDLLYLKPRINERAEKKVVYAKSRFSEVPRLTEVLARFTGFVTERAYRESGKISLSREERNMLGEYDEAYLTFSIPKKILPGEEYTIYRPVRDVLDPSSGAVLGKLIKHIGVVRVLSVDPTKPYVKSIVLESYEEIARGDLLTKRVWDGETVVPVENKVGLWSKVLDEFHDVVELGEHDYVIVDRGFKQKMRRGNRLILRWRGDGVRDVNAATQKKLPWENMGEVMIIEPFEDTSLAIVIRSIREVHRGDLLEMLRGY